MLCAEKYGQPSFIPPERDVIFQRHLRPDGKYLVFCAGRADMEELLNEADAMFGGVNGQRRIYRVFSEDARAEKTLDAFACDHAAGLKLLYCIDIVNGCQTVNSIYEVLKNVNPAKLDEEFKDAFVMLKILQINRNDAEQEFLYTKIVKYNNSQNSINEKALVANTEMFFRTQREFESKGFLLLVKQSDKNKFSNEYRTATALLDRSAALISRFSLSNKHRAADFFIPLEKLLQVINAFAIGGLTAYTKKSNMLKFESTEYTTAVSFIKNTNSFDSLLALYLLYMKAEEVKNQREDSRTPIPYYLIDCFAKFECKERDATQILTQLDSSEKIIKLIKLYTGVCAGYTNEYFTKYGIDYNKVIKRPVEYDILAEKRENTLQILLALE